MSTQAIAGPASSPVALPYSRQAAINPWLIAITVTLATFMELLDTSIANVALPHIAGGLAVSYDESTWVLTSYLVANAVVLPLSAWLSRVFGRKNYYMACVVMFTISSFLCGLAPNLGLLIFFRILQGVGGGGLAPVEQAILVDTFPPAKRAGAFALYSMAIVTAPVIGPPLGGWITDHFTWRWVFFINVPIGILSLLLTSRLVSDPPQFIEEAKAARQSGKLRIDYVGISLIALGFGALEIVLDKGQREDWLESHFIVTFLTVAILSLVFAGIWEWRHPDPVVEIKLFKERNFALSNIFYFLFGFGIFGSTVLIPQMLQALFGYSATDAGLVLGPGAFVIVALAPVVVKILPKVDPRKMIGLAFFIVALAMWHFASLDLGTDYASYAWARAFQGLGLAFLFIPVSQLVYSYLPAGKNNKASSITNLFRNLGGSFGVAFVTTMLERRTQFHHSILAQHLTPSDAGFQQTLDSITQYMIARGSSAADAAQRAYGVISATAEKNAAMLGFLDCFWLLGFVSLVGLVLSFTIKKFGSSGAAGGH
ncbi:MAG TPA: DHA2 family efflux MFS transporter permease subunit [Terriglobales bacterium]|jgi:DHA2 family multidrug resistance protein|nr:DHA2 family efflux MFS transporter permease subunit [Terriglobales bacterium]